jgi:hypothetical protein
MADGTIAMLSTSTSYRLIASNLDRSLEVKAAETSVARESAYYLENIGKIRSIDDLLKNTRLFNFTMKAFGLEDMAHAKAYMRKVLTEGIADPKSFANRINDDRFLRFAATFNFAEYGEATTASTAIRQPVVDRYVRQALEAEAGQENDGVRLALYFHREAPNVKSAYDLLADPALWEVVKTIFGFPDAMANADIDKQAAAVLKRLDIADLHDPVKLDRLLTRFAAVWDATMMTGQDPILGMFDIGGGPSIDLNLVMTLGNLRRGGV